MTAPTRTARMRAQFPALARRAGRWLLVITTVLVVGPFVLILPLNFIQPATTMVMLRRAAQRTIAGKTPRYPRRDIVGRSEISAQLRRAVLASEDDRFYLHFGFDIEEIQNALERARRGRRLRGASTITQQVAKNIFLWEGRSYFRKGYEAYLTLVLELCLPKDRTQRRSWCARRRRRQLQHRDRPVRRIPTCPRPRRACCACRRRSCPPTCRGAACPR